MKEWRCILVSHHDEVGKAIMEWEQQGWRLNSYSTAGMGGIQLHSQPLSALRKRTIRKFT
jgi:hypothetical protein